MIFFTRISKKVEIVERPLGVRFELKRIDAM